MQVETHDYSPPRRERILAWQQLQEFPICPNPRDPDSCNVYRDLQFPDAVYEHISDRSRTLWRLWRGCNAAVSPPGLVRYG